MRHSCSLALVLVAALFASVSGAPAATFQYSSYDLVNAKSVDITSPFYASTDVGGIELHGSGANAGQTLLAWCLNIFDDLRGSGIYNIGPLTIAGAGGSNPTPLTTAQIGQIGALMANGQALINTSTNVSAATQLAIWKVEYSNFAFDPTSISPAVGSLVDLFVNNVTGPNPIWAPNFNVALLSEDGNQNLAFVTPLPGAWLMMLTGIGSFIGLSYRRKRRARLATIAAA